jgi:hypothetical protein
MLTTPDLKLIRSKAYKPLTYNRQDKSSNSTVAPRRKEYKHVSCNIFITYDLITGYKYRELSSAFSVRQLMVLFSVCINWRVSINRSTSCLDGASTKFLIYRKLNSYRYLVWQMCIISVHTSKCNFVSALCPSGATNIPLFYVVGPSITDYANKLICLSGMTSSIRSSSCCRSRQHSDTWH